MELGWNRLIVAVVLFVGILFLRERQDSAAKGKAIDLLISYPGSVESSQLSQKADEETAAAKGRICWELILDALPTWHARSPGLGGSFKQKKWDSSYSFNGKGRKSW